MQELIRIAATHDRSVINQLWEGPFRNMDYITALSQLLIAATPFVVAAKDALPAIADFIERMRAIR